MTNEERTRLAALCEAATPGPWLLNGRAGWKVDRVSEYGNLPIAHALEPADAKLIAAARDAIPELLAALKYAEHRATDADAVHAVLLAAGLESSQATAADIVRSLIANRNDAVESLRAVGLERDSLSQSLAAGLDFQEVATEASTVAEIVMWLRLVGTLAQDNSVVALAVDLESGAWKGPFNPVGENRAGEGPDVKPLLFEERVQFPGFVPEFSGRDHDADLPGPSEEERANALAWERRVKLLAKEMAAAREDHLADVPVPGGVVIRADEPTDAISEPGPWQQPVYGPQQSTYGWQRTRGVRRRPCSGRQRLGHGHSR